LFETANFPEQSHSPMNPLREETDPLVIAGFLSCDRKGITTPMIAARRATNTFLRGILRLQIFTFFKS
jgi:hypothetical protein